MAVIEAGGAAGVRLRAGDRLRVVNTHGTQVVDTWALDAEDPAEYLSVEQTRRKLWRLSPGLGDELWSNRRRPLLRIDRDTAAGAHDMLFDCCDRWVYADYGAPPGHANCRDNFAAVAAAEGLGPVPAPRPVNLWMRVTVDRGGRLTLEPPTSVPGDEVVLTALRGLLVVMSACPMDITPVNRGGTPRDVAYEVLPPD